MRSSLVLTAAALFAALVQPVAAASLKLESAVAVMRHGVRPPTKAQPMPEGFAKDPWPAWPVPPGHLTPHGAAGVKQLGGYARGAYAADGLLGRTGCPRPGEVAIWADVDQRTVKTGEAWADGLAPGCGLKVGHAEGAVDPLFSPIEAGVVDYDPKAAEAAVLAHLPPGGLDGVAKGQRDVLTRLGAIYGCCAPAICQGFGVAAPCGLADLPNRVTVSGRGRPKLAGGLDLGSTAAQILVLEYADGRPLSEVGWGRASPADVSALAILHPIEFEIVARPPYMAARNAGPLARRIAETLSTPGGPKLTLLVGHDTNLASLGGLFDIHWQAPGYPADDPPPGGQLAFERLSSADGKAYVRVVFTAQAMDQLRDLTPLSAKSPPARQTLRIPGCDGGPDGACPLETFVKLVSDRAAPPR